MKNKFIRTIGKESLNDWEFKVYSNDDGTVEIRAIKNGCNQKKYTKKFENRKLLEGWLDVIFDGGISIFEEAETAEDIQKLKDILVDNC